MRTDDELSEMEECIDSEIREAVGKGFDLACGDTPLLDNCALAAIAWNRSLSSWDRTGISMGIGIHESVEFARGFDGSNPSHGAYDPEEAAMYAMGRRFRERVIAGEYRR